MAEKKTKIVLDADVINHFVRGGQLSLLPKSACMVYCRYNNDVVGSSNTKDVTDYCNEHGITFLTTNDFLFYAIHRGMLTKEEAERFIKKVINLGSNPPVVDFSKYVCTKI